MDLSFIEWISTEHWWPLAGLLKGVSLEEFLGYQENECRDLDERIGQIKATEINGRVVSFFAPFCVNYCKLYFGENQDLCDDVIVPFVILLFGGRREKDFLDDQ